MEKSKIIKGIGVIDRWYPDWGVGKITKVLKTVIKIDFGGSKGVVTYDFPHAKQFLETEEDYRKIVKQKSKKL